MMFKKFIIFLAVILILLIAPISAENNITIDNATLIQDTIDLANDSDIVYLNPGTYHESAITINKNITLQGLGEAKDIVIDGGQEDSIIIINKKVTVKLNNITFINGKSDTYGGAVYTRIAKSVHVTNCVFENNTALKDGGAVSVESKFNPNPREFFYGYLEVDNCSFINNYANFSGGAVATYYADSDIRNSEFISNYAGDFAGAVSFVNGIFTVSSSKFENNYADYDGGAIRQNKDSTLDIKDSQFVNNTAKEWGGALYNWLGKLTVDNSTISNNTAGIRGGGIFTGGPLTATSSQITDNIAESGGALYVFQEFYSIEPIVICNNNTITGNNASEGSIAYYFLLTYVKSDYENNYWGDINPNSTEWEKEFITKWYTDPAPKTWIEKPPQDAVENATPENESEIEKIDASNQNSTREKTMTNSTADKTANININSTSEKAIANFGAEKSIGHISGPGQDGKSATYLTKKNAVANQLDSDNYASIVLLILALLIFSYGVYRFKRE